VTKELAYIVMFCGGAFLFAIGGTFWKPARRFILPVLLGVVAYLSHISIVSAILATILSMVAFSMPYGDNTPILLKVFTAVAMGACLLPLQLNPIVAVVPAVFLIGMILSNKFNWFTWKWVELLTGAIWGVVAVILM